MSEKTGEGVGVGRGGLCERECAGVGGGEQRQS